MTRLTFCVLTGIAIGYSVKAGDWRSAFVASLLLGLGWQMF